MKKYLPYLFSFFITLAVGLAIFTPLVVYFGKTGRRTIVNGVNYSLLSKPQIESRLTSDFALPNQLTLSFENRQFEFNLASVSARINTSETASNLLFRRLNRGLSQYLKAFFEKKDFNLEISYDNSLFDEQVDKLASQIDKPFIPSQFDLEKGNLVYHQGQLGLEVDKVSLKEKILHSLSTYNFQPITITPTITGSLPLTAEIDNTRAKAISLIGKQISLQSPDQTLNIEDKYLISWLGFNQGCQLNLISDYVDSLSLTIKKEPIDAVFKFENNKVLEFQPSQKGYSLQSDELKSNLCKTITQLGDIPEKRLTIDLPLSYVEPKITNSAVNDMGIKELLGRGTSTFKHSSAIRNFNIEKGASIVNRILVAPGETFSFIKNLGEVTLEAGYKKAYVIRAGKTELDVGGGICQVSTTLFRAMLDAGLDITQRKAHAYRVSYYEEDSKPGFDATVFIPNPDLTFINDTGHHVLIQNILDLKEKRLTYEIYGTSDGRISEIANYRQWDASPPPSDVYIDDPTLPPGKIIQDEHRIPGLKTAFDWKVSRGGQIIHQKTFQSNYVPWAAVYRRGPAIH